MKTIKQYPSKDLLCSLFEYNNGKLFWKTNKAIRSKIGSEAGRINDKGRYRVCIDGKDYLRSRIVYIMHFGDIPNGLLIDHKNEIKFDDRIENLRLATNSQNRNNTSNRRDNNSGTKGVSWNKQNKKWVAQISYESKVRHLGLFKNKEEAASVYKEAATKHHGEFAKI